MLVGRDHTKLETVAAEITSESLCVAADLTDPDEVLRVFSTVEETWGPVATLVANAGTSLAAPVVDTTDAHWQQMLERNLTAPFRCIRRVVPSMLEAGQGRIVVIASVGASAASDRSLPTPPASTECSAWSGRRPPRSPGPA